MTSILDMPNEMVLMVGRYLDDPDLCSLCLTARKFRPVA